MPGEYEGDEANAHWHPKEEVGAEKDKNNPVGVASGKTEQEHNAELSEISRQLEDPELALRRKLDEARRELNAASEGLGSTSAFTGAGMRAYDAYVKAKANRDQLEKQLESYIEGESYPKPKEVDPGEYLKTHSLEADWQEAEKTRALFEKYEEARGAWYKYRMAKPAGNYTEHNRLIGEFIIAEALVRTRLRNLGIEPKEIERHFEIYGKALDGFLKIEVKGDTTDGGRKKRDKALNELRKAEMFFVGSR
jgi:hypothetical protein